MYTYDIPGPPKYQTPKNSPKGNNFTYSLGTDETPFGGTLDGEMGSRVTVLRQKVDVFERDTVENKHPA